MGLKQVKWRPEMCLALLQLLLGCVGSFLQVCVGSSFCLYTDLCALKPGTLVCLSVNLLNI